MRWQIRTSMVLRSVAIVQSCHKILWPPRTSMLLPSGPAAVIDPNSLQMMWRPLKRMDLPFLSPRYCAELPFDHWILFRRTSTSWSMFLRKGIEILIQQSWLRHDVFVFFLPRKKQCLARAHVCHAFSAQFHSFNPYKFIRSVLRCTTGVLGQFERHRWYSGCCSWES